MDCEAILCFAATLWYIYMRVCGCMYVCMNLNEWKAKMDSVSARRFTIWRNSQRTEVSSPVRAIIGDWNCGTQTPGQGTQECGIYAHPKRNWWTVPTGGEKTCGCLLSMDATTNAVQGVTFHDEMLSGDNEKRKCDRKIIIMYYICSTHPPSRSWL